MGVTQLQMDGRETLRWMTHIWPFADYGGMFCKVGGSPRGGLLRPKSSLGAQTEEEATFFKKGQSVLHFRRPKHSTC